MFETDRQDELLTWEDLFRRRPTDRQLLWVDITGDLSQDDAGRLADRFELHPRTRRSLVTQGLEPTLALHRGDLHVRIAAEPSDEHPEQAAWLDVIAATNLTITHHGEPIEFLDDVDHRIERDTAVGEISSSAFFAAIVDTSITSYHRAVDAIEDDVDRLDADSLRLRRRELLEDLVALRRRIARLRTLLADHRSIFAALAAPDVASFVGDPETAASFKAVSARFDGAMGAVEASREALLGSFDVFMSRTAQRTNEVMKVLTLTTVLLLPGALIAGLLGMNLVVPLPKDDPISFWIVVGAIVLLALSIVVVARRREWL
jgi:magnesium transporter